MSLVKNAGRGFCRRNFGMQEFLDRHQKAPRFRFISHFADPVLFSHGTIREVQCVQDDRNMRQPFMDRLRCFQSVQAGHCQIQNYKVRPQFNGLFDGFLPVNGFTANLQVRMRLKCGPEPSQH